tara:strand:+ start:859 stop:1329 length:471 start_codon:yes stop_codon:yes gene_type:complete
MIKKYFYFLIFLMTFGFIKSYGWETKINLTCVDDNLNPCSEIKHNNQNFKKKNKSDKNISKKELKFDAFSNQKTKNHKKILQRVVKKEVVIQKDNKEKLKIIKKDDLNLLNDKNLTLVERSNKTNLKTNFSKKLSFEDFKTSIINYNKNSNYPNID